MGATRPASVFSAASGRVGFFSSLGTRRFFQQPRDASVFSAASLLNMFANALKIFVERLLVLVVNDVQQVFQLVADF